MSVKRHVLCGSAMEGGYFEVYFDVNRGGYTLECSCPEGAAGTTETKIEFSAALNAAIDDALDEARRGG